jgi:peptidoglycan/LPS O-acetylase OafA/YrhL
VLAVVFYHYGVPGITGGFVGVDIFFVISGYLITNLLITELNERGRIDFLRFYGRRARRLLPAAFAVTIVVIISGVVILSPPEQIPVAKAGAASSLYVSNFWFLQQTTISRRRARLIPFCILGPFRLKSNFMSSGQQS